MGNDIELPADRFDEQGRLIEYYARGDDGYVISKKVVFKGPQQESSEIEFFRIRYSRAGSDSRSYYIYNIKGELIEDGKYYFPDNPRPNEKRIYNVDQYPATTEIYTGDGENSPRRVNTISLGKREIKANRVNINKVFSRFSEYLPAELKETVISAVEAARRTDPNYYKDEYDKEVSGPTKASNSEVVAEKLEEPQKPLDSGRPIPSVELPEATGGTVAGPGQPLPRETSETQFKLDLDPEPIEGDHPSRPS